MTGHMRPAQKVLLVNPPVRHPLGINIGTENRAQSPHLGLLYLASYLERGGREVALIDCGAGPRDLPALEEAMRAHAPDLVGITATTPSFRNALATARVSKRLFPEVPVVLGGYHPSLFAEQTLLHEPAVDLVCRGEAEITLGELAEGAPLDQVAGLSRRGPDGRVLHAPDRPAQHDLDVFPFPARHLVRGNRYGSMGGLVQMADFRRYTALITSRGCPYGCRYCCVNAYAGRTYRVRSVANIEAEVLALKRQGIDTLYIQDDTFAINRHLPEICEMLGGHGITWFCLARVDTRPEYFRLMARGGCRAIYFGVENFAPSVQDYFQKRFGPDQIASAVRLAHDAGMEVLITLILGSPVETEEDVEVNRRALERLDIDLLELNLLTYYPGTALWQEVPPERRPWDRELPVVEASAAHAAEELSRRIALLKRTFYRRPGYLLRQAWRTLARRRDLLWINLPNLARIGRYLARDQFSFQEGGRAR